MRVFLTGGSGYIGGALARRLTADGHQLRALVRPTSRREALESSGAQCVVGDILAPESLRKPMAGVDWVVHAAAELDMEAPLARMRATNVEGSDNVAAAALAAGVPRFLLLSSVAAFGGSPVDGTATTETAEIQHPLPTRYCLTKHEGERAVRRWQEQGLAVDVVYPSLVYGPPGKKRGANIVLRDIVLGRMPFMVGGDRRVSWVFLDDLVDGLARMIEEGPPGRRYLMTGEARRLDEVVAEACELAAVEPPSRRLPIGIVKTLAPVAMGLFRLAGKRPPLTPQLVRSIERHWCFDDSLARRELGWQPRGLDEGLPPTVDFLLGRA